MVLVIICGAFSLRQSILARRLRDLNDEVARIGEFAERFKSERGHYPSDIAEYDFERPALRQFITYYPNDPGGSDLFDSYWIKFHPCDDAGLVPFDGLGIYHAYSRGNYWYEDD